MLQLLITFIIYMYLCSPIYTVQKNPKKSLKILQYKKHECKIFIHLYKQIMDVVMFIDIYFHNGQNLP